MGYLDSYPKSDFYDNLSKRQRKHINDIKNSQKDLINEAKSLKENHPYEESYKRYLYASSKLPHWEYLYELSKLAKEQKLFWYESMFKKYGHEIYLRYGDIN